MAQCPDCEAFLDLEADEVDEGEIISCPECGADLEVVNTNPVELDLAEDEDLEDEEEDDDKAPDEEEDEEEEEDDYEK